MDYEQMASRMSLIPNDSMTKAMIRATNKKEYWDYTSRFKVLDEEAEEAEAE
jgi:hypothetical protein